MGLKQEKLDEIVHSMGREVAASVWRADQMGSMRSHTIPSGFRALDTELPGGGWPRSGMTELLVQQPGIGEIRLIRYALAEIAKTQRVAFLEPPHTPQISAWTSWGMPADKMLLVKSKTTADALWAAEQVLRNGSCGAMLFWQPQIRNEALRRLQLASQASETMFWLVRPISAQENSSPAPLRLALTPANGGINVHVVKRRGPIHEKAIHVALEQPFMEPVPAATAPVRAPEKSVRPVLVYPNRAPVAV